MKPGSARHTPQGSLALLLPSLSGRKKCCPSQYSLCKGPPPQCHLTTQPLKVLAVAGGSGPIPQSHTPFIWERLHSSKEPHAEHGLVAKTPPISFATALHAPNPPGIPLTSQARCCGRNTRPNPGSGTVKGAVAGRWAPDLSTPCSCCLCRNEPRSSRKLALCAGPSLSPSMGLWRVIDLNRVSAMETSKEKTASWQICSSLPASEMPILPPACPPLCTSG